jgi:5-(carboxyamino)imidazole ribonucleotide synthase
MRVGLLGGGQLGRMLALAGYPLGMRFRTLDHSAEAPAGQLTELIVGEFDDRATLERFASGLDLVTYEFENVPVSSARFLSQRLAVYPPPEALEVGQDRLAEKTFFQSLGISTPPFAEVNSPDDLERALSTLGLPVVLKTRRFGYDGKGQFVIKESDDARRAWRAVGGVPLLLEQFVAFEREVSVIAVRGRGGETAFYPLVENLHRDGMLRRSIAPAPDLSAALQSQAETYAERVMGALNYVGVVAIELFQVEGQLLANEMAPRVHNSGHWTIEGAETSQFENHLRAVAGLPLGPTAAVGRSGMLNIIGTTPDARDVLAVEGAHLHLYGKAARPGRKLGHVTVRGDDARALDAKITALENLIGRQDSLDS